MATTVKFPVTFSELADLAGSELARFPSDFDEYWELLEEAEYKADFHHGQIIAMSYETNPHSNLETEIQFWLRQIFPRAHYQIHSSNRPIYLPDCEGHAVFNPDCSVVPNHAPRFVYKPGFDAETSPLFVCEILSKSTSDYDLYEKLPCYKKIPSLRYILYADSRRMFVTLFERIGDTHQWVNTDYDQPEQTFLLHNTHIRLQDLYEGIL